MSERLLPEEFERLEGFAREWALPTGPERAAKRLSSDMEEIQELYDAVLPRAEEIIDYLDQYSLGEMAEDAQCLFYLALSLVEVSRAVELYGQPGAEGLDERRFVLTCEPKLP